MKEAGIFDFKEKASHGDVLMPIQRYRCNYQELCPHWHEEVELTWIEKGNVDYVINFEPFRICQDDILLITPHMLHSASVGKGEEMISESLVFHLDLMGYQIPDACTMKYISPLQKGKYRFAPVIHAGQPGHEELLSCIRQLLPCVHTGEQKALPGQKTAAENQLRGSQAAGWNGGDELLIKELLFRIFRLLYGYGYVVRNESSAGDTEMERKLKKAIVFIQDHYTESMTIGEIAQVCHFSQTHFMNFFKRFAGMTCVEYINRYRLSCAAAMLASTDCAVTEAALENGFRNISYFNKLFRREFGATPREYRKAAVGIGRI